MAYLHCHTKDCNWSQDDFWSKSYNPLTKIWDDIKWLLKPRYIKWDWGFATYEIPELIKYTGIKVKLIEKFFPNDATIKIKYNENEEIQKYYKAWCCFSWKWLLLEIVKEYKNFKAMKWWTYEQWLRDKDTAVCPKCGQRNFDID